MELDDPTPTQGYPLRTQEHAKPREIHNDPGSMVAPVDTRKRRGTSDDDDVPLRERLQGRDLWTGSSDRKKAVSDRPRLREQIKEPIIEPRKKPGPQPWAAKPIMKNDMVAKMAVIHEIEELWGKNFITAYIPKCHRPLIKKGKDGKRTMYRKHEANPKNWLPSVLKAILMIARLTSDKQWLKKAMAEVVRYRIKNTGNRKPQLVTTDFDVIEDMLMKQWTCADSFQVRYKHLLMAQPKEDRQTDEDIDHILGVGSGVSDSEIDSGDEDASGNHSDGKEDRRGMDEDEEDISGGYYQRSDYVNDAPHYPPKARLPSKESKQAKSSSKQPAMEKQLPHQLPHQPLYGYGAYGPYPGYGPPMNGYNQAMPAFPPHMKGYPLLPPHMYGYGPYGGYGQQTLGKGPHHSGPPGHHGYLGMPPYHPHQTMTPSPSTVNTELRGQRAIQNTDFNENTDFDSSVNVSSGDYGRRGDSRFSPFGGSSSKRRGRVITQDHTPTQSYGMGMGTVPSTEPPTPHMIATNPRVKREPGVEAHPIAVDDFDNPSNYLGGGQSEEPAEEMDEAMQLEIQEMELQHKLIQLKKKLAASKARKTG
jgi:hypothetical protein